MRTFGGSALVFCAFLCTAASATAQPPAGALAIDERQGDRCGWAVDHETTAAARVVALSECGAGCSVVLTFGRCAAYAADQDADSTAVGWAESYGSAAVAQQAVLSSRGGSGCIVRVWGCNGPVVEEGLGLDVDGRDDPDRHGSQLPEAAGPDRRARQGDQRTDGAAAGADGKTARSFRPSAPTTLRTVSKFGTRSPDSAL